MAGVVTDYDSREPVFAARVYAFWSDPAAPAQGADSVAVARADSDIDGSFRLCHVPTTLPVRLRAEAGNWVGETTLLPPGWRGEAVRDLRMRRGARP